MVAGAVGLQKPKPVRMLLRADVVGLLSGQMGPPGWLLAQGPPVVFPRSLKGSQESPGILHLSPLVPDYRGTSLQSPSPLRGSPFGTVEETLRAKPEEKWGSDPASPLRAIGPWGKSRRSSEPLCLHRQGQADFSVMGML